MFLGFGVGYPSFQIISTFILQIILLGICIPFIFFKHKFMVFIKIILQVIFLFAILGILIIQFNDNFSAIISRERTGRYTIVMFLIFILLLFLFGLAWIVFRYCFKKKFRNYYYNRDFADEEFLKYYKKIPEKIFAFGQKANEKSDNIKSNKTYVEESVKSNTFKFKDDIHYSNQNAYIKSELDNDIGKLKDEPQNIRFEAPLKPDQGDMIIKDDLKMFSEENNNFVYNVNQSKIPGSNRSSVKKNLINNINENNFEKVSEKNLNNIISNDDNIEINHINPSKPLDLSDTNKNYDYTYSRKEEPINNLKENSDFSYYPNEMSFPKSSNQLNFDIDKNLYSNNNKNSFKIDVIRESDEIQQSLQFSYSNPIKDKENENRNHQNNLFTEKMTELMGQDKKEDNESNMNQAIEISQQIELEEQNFNNMMIGERFDTAANLK